MASLASWETEEGRTDSAAAGDDTPASKQRKYERKIKRFIWPNDLHRLFCSCHLRRWAEERATKGSHFALMEAAGPDSGLTTEYPKSHLQKYRLNYERSRMEFREYCDRSSKRNLVAAPPARLRIELLAGQEVTPIRCLCFPSVTQSAERDVEVIVTGEREEVAIRHRAIQKIAACRSDSYSTSPLASSPYPCPIKAVFRCNDRDLAAAAAAVAIPPSVGTAIRLSLLEELLACRALTDPQWSILNSLVSSQLAGGIDRGANSTDGLMLHEDPSDLQMQIHLAMQAQMNLHRQMLTRKVEVAQHLARHSSMGTINSSSVTNNRSNQQVSARCYDESWGNAQQLQHQQYQQHQDRQDHYQQQMNLLSRPSLTAEARMTQVSVPTASARTDTVVAASITSETAVAPTSTAVNGSVEAISSAAGLPTETKGDDDGIDLYRWDRIDLNVELDGDDLFGFLKS
ncbi:unnamed protein product [Peronospora destructor]|uniref:Uncharacterized protein n=1 Tax=Peronospora destructor TaxID=86335 RepID=A0AAV0U6Y7_9STRA|nr:unnamed protein product [Peronospora destructor]